MIEQNYSVLMSVYRKEKAEYLQKSIDSMLSQTVPPQDFVIVCDGLLGDELNQVLQKKKQEYPECFQIVQLPETEDWEKHSKKDWFIVKMNWLHEWTAMISVFQSVVNGS